MTPGENGSKDTRDRYAAGFCNFFRCPSPWTVYFGLSYTLKFAFRPTRTDSYGAWTRVALFENGEPWAKDGMVEDDAKG
jgi:hypothetical protein